MPVRERLFVAIWPDEAANQAISAADPWLETLDDFRITRRPLRHVTALFLGDTDAEQKAAVIERLADAAGRTAPIEAAITGIGAIPTPQRARIIAAMIDPSTGLGELMRRLEAEIGSVVEASPSGRPPNPHVTLARRRSRRRPRRLGLESAPLIEGRLVVDELDLVRSTLTQSGPIYESVKSFPLAPQ